MSTRNKRNVTTYVQKIRGRTCEETNLVVYEPAKFTVWFKRLYTYNVYKQAFPVMPCHTNTTEDHQSAFNPEEDQESEFPVDKQYIPE